jgi:hypothetical protein
MQRRTPLFVICSSRPRVGKTLLARALAEFFRADARPVAAFDVNPDEFALVDYLPGYTAVASVADTRGQIALFDQLLAPDQVPKVVDLGHALFDRFFTVIQEIGFLEEARRRAVAPVVLFVADPDRRSRQGYDMLGDRFPRLPLVPVLNEALPNMARFRDDFPGTRLGGAPLSVPALSPVLKGVIERPSFSFAALAVTAADTTTELYGWTRRVFVEFRELELRLLLAELGTALKFSA